jgi:hypothetical protein
MDTNKVILECLKAVVSGEGVDEKLSILEAIINENRHASDSEVDVLLGVAEKPKKKKAK